MRSSAVEGQHAPRAKQTPPSGSSGATAGPAGGTPTSPHTNSISPRTQSSSASLSVKSSTQVLHRGTGAPPPSQNRSSSQLRPVSGQSQLPRSQQRAFVAPSPNQIQQQRPPNSPPVTIQSSSSTKSLNSVSKGPQPRFSQSQLQKLSASSPQAASKQTLSSQSPGTKVQPGFKQGSPATKSAQPSNPPNFVEYDDQEWDVGVGHLIIDLDADIAQADRGKMSGVSPAAANNASQGTALSQAAEDKHSLKMKIKRTKPPTKTSEAKHEIVKTDVAPATGVVITPTTPGTQTAPQHNGATPKEENGSIQRGPMSTPRAIYKKEKRRLDVNGITPSPLPNQLPHSRNSIHASSLASVIPSSTSGNISQAILTPVATAVTVTAPISQSFSTTHTCASSTSSTHTTPTSVKSETQPVTSASVNSVRIPLSNNIQPCGTFQPISEQSSKDIVAPAFKKTKLSDENVKIDACVGTSVGTLTEPECLGPCEPGSSVTLEGIVWHETDGGVLVVNVTWRGKTYVGTLLDCTKHDWAPPRFCDSPTSDLESRTPKGRAKRGRSTATVIPATTSSTVSASSTSMSSSTPATSTTTNTTSTELTVSETRSGKFRNASVKNRARGGGNSSASPVKDIAGSKRKGREGDLPASVQPDSKVAKKARSMSRVTPTNGASSPSPDQYQTEHSTSNSEVVQTPISPQLIECPEPNCNKKYKHINGLKYHQSHAHNNIAGTIDVAVSNSSEARSGGENTEINEYRQPSPKLLVSTPIDASVQDLVKPAVLRPPSVTSNGEKGGNSPIRNTGSSQGNTYSSDSAVINLQKHSNGENKLDPSITCQPEVQLVQSGNSLSNPNSNQVNCHPQENLSTQNTPTLPTNAYNQSPIPTSENREQKLSHQGNVVVLAQSHVSSSHPIVSSQPKISEAPNQQSLHQMTQNQVIQKHPTSANASHLPQGLTLQQIQQQLKPPPHLQPQLSVSSSHHAHLPQHLQHLQHLQQAPVQLIQKQPVPTQGQTHKPVSPQVHSGQPQLVRSHMQTGGQAPLRPQIPSLQQSLSSSPYSDIQGQIHPSQPVVQHPSLRGELKQDGLNRISSGLPASSLTPSSRSHTLGSSDSTSAPTSVISSLALPVSSIPQGTPLSSLPGSTVTSLKVKPGVECDQLSAKPREMVNGLPAKTEPDLGSREDARSPAYSDISDANEAAPVIDEDGEVKDFKDEKKVEMGVGGASPYAYGLYYGGYGPPPHSYMMPPLQHPPVLPPKPGELKELKDKVSDKDKKEYLTLPGGSEFMKVPSQYLYSYSHLYPPGYPDMYMRDPMSKEINEKPKLDHDESLEENADKGPTDLSKSSNISASNPTDKDTRPDHPALLKDHYEGRIPIPSDRRPVDPALPYRYVSAYDPRAPLVGVPPEKSVDSTKVLGPKPPTPSLLLSPSLNTSSPANNGLSKDDKNEKRPEMKSEGVKPTMETTGPPPPPTSTAYYPPFPYGHVPFDPYRPPMIPGMSLGAGLPPYLGGPPPPGLAGLRYQLGVPSCPEDLSPGGTGPHSLPPGLYPGSHKMAELQERAQKSPSGQLVTSVGSPFSMIGNNPPFSCIPSITPSGHPPSVSSPSANLPCSIGGGNQPTSHNAPSHLVERKTPPVGLRFPPHPSLPEGYPYPFLPTHFPPHFAALGVSPTGMPNVGGGGPPPGVTPTGMVGGAPPPK